MPAAESRVPTGNGGANRDESEPAQGLLNRLALGSLQPFPGQELFPGNDGAVNSIPWIVEQPAVAAGIEIVDQDIGVYEDPDRCHARISFRKAASD